MAGSNLFGMNPEDNFWHWWLSVASAQVNWQALWVSRSKRSGLRIAGWLLLTAVIIFPIGIFSGEHLFSLLSILNSSSTLRDPCARLLCETELQAPRNLLRMSQLSTLYRSSSNTAAGCLDQVST